jgi:hypothetical protein
MSEDTTEHGAIRLDRAYAAGMRHALAMAAQGEWDEARKVADRLSREALCVLRRVPSGMWLGFVRRDLQRREAI